MTFPSPSWLLQIPSGHSLSDYHRSLVRRLEQAQRRGQVQVWVNPEQPSESFLVRELRWPRLGFMLLLGGIFSLVGGLSFAWAGAGAAPVL